MVEVREELKPQTVHLPILLLRRLAFREERISHDLRCLPPCYIGEWSEVRALLVVTRLKGSTTIVPAHYTYIRKAHDPQVEWVILWYVCVIQTCWSTPNACCIGYDLRGTCGAGLI